MHSRALYGASIQLEVLAINVAIIIAMYLGFNLIWLQPFEPASLATTCFF